MMISRAAVVGEKNRLTVVVVGQQQQQQQQLKYSSSVTEDPSVCIAARSGRSQTILSTKSLTNLITINRKPLEPGDRRRKQRERQQQREQKQEQHQLQLQQFQCQNQQQKEQKEPVNRNRRTIRKHFSSKTKQEKAISAQKSVYSLRLKTGNRYSLLGLVALVLLLSLQLAAQVDSLQCYHCSSVDDPGCDEAFTSRSKYNMTDCAANVPVDQTTKVCRKITQYIEHKKVIIRSCGHIDEQEPKDRKGICYKRSGTFAIMMESCNCYEDYCNHSASLVPNLSVLSILLVSSCSYSILFNRRLSASL